MKSSASMLVKIDDLRAAPSSLLQPAAIPVALFERLAAQAEQEQDQNKRAELLCSALSEIGKAVKADPLDSQYLINWANLRQLLGESAVCFEPLTAGSFSEAAAAAVRNDPTNVDVLFAAARIFEWAGRNDEAHARLKQVLSLATSLSPEQRGYIFHRLIDPPDLERILPSRFPQIADWSIALSDANPELFSRGASELAVLQRQAIELSREDAHEGRVPQEVHERRLLSLYRAPANAAIRRTLDREMAAHTSGQSQLVQYLRDRQRLEEAAIVRAVITSDTRPLKAPLLAWSPQDDICLDDFYVSIGFYLPDGEAPKLIELHGRKEQSLSQLPPLRLYVSEDNFNWSELQGNIQISTVRIGDLPTIAIRPNAGYYKYWKLTTGASTRSKAFCELAHRFLTVYRTSPEAYS